MLVYGTQYKSIPGDYVENYSCPNCGQQQCHSYAHLKSFAFYKIPTIYLGKKVNLACQHCQKHIEQKDLPKELTKKLKKSIGSTFNIVKQFTGIFVFAAFIVFALFMGEKSKETATQYINAPEINDLYIVNIRDIYNFEESARYGALKLIEVEADNYVFKIGSWTSRKATKVERHYKKTTQDFLPNTDTYTKEELLTLLNTGLIRSIER